jgi:hypothetical protein
MEYKPSTPFYVRHQVIVNNKDGDPGGSRTPNPQIRSLMLYPVELRGHLVATSGGRRRFYHSAALAQKLSLTPRNQSREPMPKAEVIPKRSSSRGHPQNDVIPSRAERPVRNLLFACTIEIHQESEPQALKRGRFND